MNNKDIDFSLLLELAKDSNTRIRRVQDDVHDLKLRVTSIEHGMAGIHTRMDRFDERLDRLESRTGILETEQ